jgi:hypothetical protein
LTISGVGFNLGISFDGYLVLISVDFGVDFGVDFSGHPKSSIH